MSFTVEEVNLMCVFNTESRTALISGLRDAIPDIDEDDMREIAQSALAGLEAMSDEEFAALVLTPDYDSVDGDETEV